MAELLLPGDILSMTARAADRLMGAGNGDAALLYLWLLRRGGRLEPEAARRALKWDVPRLEDEKNAKNITGDSSIFEKSPATNFILYSNKLNGLIALSFL